MSSALEAEDREMLADRCVAVGAEVFTVAPDFDADGDGGKLRQRLNDAASMALIRSLRLGR